MNSLIITTVAVNSDHVLIYFVFLRNRNALHTNLLLICCLHFELI